MTPRIRRALTRGAHDDRVIAAILFVVFLLVRLPWRSQFLVNWDAVNFALGIDEFDLRHHQPHPPGYIGYVLLGRAVAALVGDVNAALTLISVVAGAAFPAVLYLLARRFTTGRWALGTALLVGSAPLVWYYSVVALTYMVAGTLVTALALAVHHARHERSTRSLVAASVLLVLLGAIRQTDQLLLLPLWVMALRPFATRVRWRAVALVAVGTLAWLVPLVWMAGGPIPYLHYAASLAAFAGGRTWVLGGNLAGLAQNLGLVLFGTLLGLTALLVVPVVAWRRGARVRGAMRPDDQRFLLVWLAPALAVYTLVHTGQLGYVLIVLAPLAVGLASLGARAAERRPAAHRLRLRPRGNVLRVGLTGALTGVNALAFFILPPAALALLKAPPEQRDPGLVPTATTVWVDEPDGAVDRTRQYDVRANDAYLDDLADLIAVYDTDETALLAVPASGGSFRHLTFYAADHTVHAFGEDRHGSFGYLFTSHEDGGYDLVALGRSRQELRFPPEVDRLLVPDRELRERLDPDLDVRVVESRNGVQLAVVERPADHVLVVRENDDGEHRLTLLPEADVRISRSLI